MRKSFRSEHRLRCFDGLFNRSMAFWSRRRMGIEHGHGLDALGLCMCSDEI